MANSSGAGVRVIGMSRKVSVGVGMALLGVVGVLALVDAGRRVLGYPPAPWLVEITAIGALFLGFWLVSRAGGRPKPN